jgi:hypothetical protein
VADLRNLSVRDGNETIIDDLIGENDPAPHDAIDRVHSICSQMQLPNSLSELFAWQCKGVREGRGSHARDLDIIGAGCKERVFIL